jgi:hypothetical protein
MCDPVIGLGIATFVVGSISTVASYTQQQAQTSAANEAAWNSYQAQSRAAEQRSAQQQNEALFNLQNYNNQVELNNQKTLNNFLLNQQQTTTGNLRLQQEYLASQQQANMTNLQAEAQYQQQLNQAILSETRAETQEQFNRLNRNDALEAANAKLRDQQILKSFEAERLMASSIQAQGSILSTGRSGQSIGILVNDELAKLGRDKRMLNRNYESSTADFYSASTNAFLLEAQGNSEAIASIMPRPAEPFQLPDIAPPIFAEVGPDPVFTPYSFDPGPISGPSYGAMPTAIPGPSSLGLVAGIGQSVLGGVNAGMQAQSLKNSIPTPKAKPYYGPAF